MKYIAILSDQEQDIMPNQCINQLRSRYINVISELAIQYNITPCIISPNINLIDLYINSFDGFISTGSKSHVSPSLYNKSLHHSIKESDINQDLSIFHNKIFKKACSMDIPYLGICYGMQSMNVAMGGSLHQNISDISHFNHLKNQDLSKSIHEVEIQEGTLLKSITGRAKIMTNTSHMQCIDHLGDGFTVNAISTYDNIVEGIEMADKKFCIGVQWHPEFLTSEGDRKIFEGLFKAI